MYKRLTVDSGILKMCRLYNEMTVEELANELNMNPKKLYKLESVNTALDDEFVEELTMIFPDIDDYNRYGDNYGDINRMWVGYNITKHGTSAYFRRLLKNFRDENHLSQRDMANDIGLKYSNYAMLEAGKSGISFRKFCDIVEFCGIIMLINR